VYDQVSGLKLFGSSAFYVMAADGSYATFLRRADAEKHAASVNGKMLTFSEALASLA
jgi:NitT/TauT family transport system substrate-binding protein